MGRLTLAAAVLATAVLGVAACGGDDDSPPERRAVSVYFLRDGKLAAARRTVQVDGDVATAALRALLEGPTARERAVGLYTAIPEGTTLEDLSVEEGTAHVGVEGLSASGRREQLGQIVYTLTQPGSARLVRLQDGTAGARRDFEDVTPAIFVERPVVGERVRAPIRLHGTANTFEANFTIRVTDRNGRVLREHFATATSGSGTRGTFDVRFPVPGDYEGPIQLVVFEPSAKDGKPLHTVRIPLFLAQ